jgi:hypothetical protein
VKSDLEDSQRQNDNANEKMKKEKMKKQLSMLLKQRYHS